MKHTSLTALYDYQLQIGLREHPSLKALREATASNKLAHMQTEPLQAQFMQFLISLLQAKKVLELGTFTGYSALAMALALPDDGSLITCDISEEWTSLAHPFWSDAKQNHKIQLRLGPALKSLETLYQEGYEQQFDFIFIDADKTNYIPYYEHALKLVSPRGLIAIDNIFWDAKVIDTSDTRAQTREIRRLNERIMQDDRVDVSLLDIADGLFLVKLKT